jgi:hypothetical protein
MTERIDILMSDVFLTPNDLKIATDIVNNLSWKYVREPKIDGRSVGHFISDLSEYSLFKEKIFDFIQKFTGKKFNLERVYADGRIAGQEDGNFKKDERDNRYTFLMFLSEYNRNIKFGGQTIFKGERDTTRAEPMYNSVAFFKSNVLNKRAAPKQNLMGITVVYELEELI